MADTTTSSLSHAVVGVCSPGISIVARNLSAPQVVTNQGISQAFIEKQKDPAKAYRDDMNKIRDDPLLAIKQAEKRQREKIMDNPLKIAQFKEVSLLVSHASVFPLSLPCFPVSPYRWQMIFSCALGPCVPILTAP